MIEIKEYISQATGLPHDSLHIHAGLALYLCARMLFQGRGGAIVSFALVATVALFSEMSDYVINENLLSSREPDHVADLIATCLWPAVLCGIKLVDIRSVRINGAWDDQARQDAAQPLAQPRSQQS